MYNYEENIKIITTPKGDKVITMNEEILNSIIVCLYEAIDQQMSDRRTATAEDTARLLRAIREANK